VRRILGIGSPFGADRLGWHAVELLQRLRSPDWELIKLDRPGSDLIRYIEHQQDVVILDAVQAGQTPGRAMRLEMEDLRLAACRTSSHGLGVADALEMAAQLGLLPQRLLLIGLEAGADPNRLPSLFEHELLSLL
jgi:hydrogenase maturation protease